ncbi:MAG: response regulator transcription factor [Flavobacteriales bacterium]|nr:response regulator transcription factor [Flavobacteriales bacterium]
MENIRMVIADDHQLVLQGLVAILEKEEDFEIVGTAHNMRESVTQLQKGGIDVLLTDLNMPGKNGLEMLQELQQGFPFTKIVVITMYYDRNLVAQLDEMQIDGYLLKHASGEELVEAIRSVHFGEKYRQDSLRDMSGDYDFAFSIDNEIKDSFVKQYALGKREMEVLLLVALGKSSQEIADALHISSETVGTHRRNIKYKVGLKNTAEIAAFAVRNQLI